MLVLESILLILVVKEFCNTFRGQTGNHLNLLSISADEPQTDIGAVELSNPSVPYTEARKPLSVSGWTQGQQRPDYIDELFYRALAVGIRGAPCFGPSTTTTAPISTRL